MSSVAGFVDRVERSTIWGWACSTAADENPVEVELVVDGVVVSHAVAANTLPEAPISGLSDTNVGFELPVPRDIVLDATTLVVRLSNGSAYLETPRSSFVNEGYIERVDHQMIHGWAWKAGFPQERAELQLRNQTGIVTNFFADIYREDLRGAGIGDGAHAFALDFTRLSANLRPGDIWVSFVEGGDLVDLSGRRSRINQSSASKGNSRGLGAALRAKQALKSGSVEAASLTTPNDTPMTKSEPPSHIASTDPEKTEPNLKVSPRRKDTNDWEEVMEAFKETFHLKRR